MQRGDKQRLSFKKRGCVACQLEHYFEALHSVVDLLAFRPVGALSFVHGRIGPLGRFSYSGAVLKDFRCAEMSSAMPTGS